MYFGDSGKPDRSFPSSAAIYLDIIFNCSMAILLLYLFNPFTKNIKIDFVVKELLFLYAFILLFKNFENYVNEDKVVKILQNIFFN